MHRFHIQVKYQILIPFITGYNHVNVIFQPFDGYELR